MRKIGFKALTAILTIGRRSRKHVDWTMANRDFLDDCHDRPHCGLCLARQRRSSVILIGHVEQANDQLTTTPSDDEVASASYLAVDLRFGLLVTSFESSFSAAAGVFMAADISSRTTL
jgi:hypothetical protein